MIITAIKAQIKSESRVSLFIDGKFFCSVDVLQLTEMRLHVGQELTEEYAGHIKQEGAFSKAYNRAINYLAIRPRSTKEIRDYLWRKQYEPEIAERVMERLEQKGYLRDQQFAKSWVQSRSLTKPMSRRRLSQELSQKGIKDEAKSVALADFDEEAALRQIIEKKGRFSRFRNDKQKFIQYLARQGFSFDLIQSCLRQAEGGYSEMDFQ